MSTNVPIDSINSFWDDIIVEAHTEVVPFIHYRVLKVIEPIHSLIIEEEKVGSGKELHQLFIEFAQEDLELAEMGMAEYSDILLAEDMG